MPSPQGHCHQDGARQTPVQGPSLCVNLEAAVSDHFMTVQGTSWTSSKNLAESGDRVCPAMAQYHI